MVYWKIIYSTDRRLGIEGAPALELADRKQGAWVGSVGGFRGWVPWVGSGVRRGSVPVVGRLRCFCVFSITKLHHTPRGPGAQPHPPQRSHTSDSNIFSSTAYFSEGRNVWNQNCSIV